MPRRGENIYKRKDGRWEGRYIRGRTPAGKRNTAMFMPKAMQPVVRSGGRWRETYLRSPS